MPSLSGSSSVLVGWPPPNCPRARSDDPSPAIDTKYLENTPSSRTFFFFLFREDHQLMAVLRTWYHDDFEMAGLSIVMMWYVVDDDFAWWVKERGMSSRQ